MPERELDHLPDHLQLAEKPADVFVVDIGDLLLLSFSGLVGSLFELDLGIFGDHGDPLGGHLGDHQGNRVADYIDPHRLPFHDRAAAEHP